ncbi:MAG: phosphoadenylyl-sulfate reductase [Bacteroidota bacterium]|nr:phosphoadenylyl-sulfate reductase [Bacteroidota bacterium]
MKEYNNIIQLQTIKEQLEALSRKHKNKIVFSTSFGLEDQVITDIIFNNNIPITVFTLDTARLFPETYKVWNKTIEKYEKPIKVYFPDNKETEKLLEEKGPYSFYHSIANRKECCNIRKVKPLKRALAGNELWVTGLRAEQSTAREDLESFVEDPALDIVKFNPLKDWTFEEVKAYVEDNNVPYNALHNKGFVSIGCEPCTRAVKKGDNFRSGRWWWENKSTKECGLHEVSSADVQIKSTNIIN